MKTILFILALVQGKYTIHCETSLRNKTQQILAQKGWKRCKDNLNNGRVTSAKNNKDKSEVNCTCNKGFSLVDYQNNPYSGTITCVDGNLTPRVSCAKVVEDKPDPKPTQSPQPTYAPPATTQKPTTPWTGEFPRGEIYSHGLEKLVPVTFTSYV